MFILSFIYTSCYNACKYIITNYSLTLYVLWYLASTIICGFGLTYLVHTYFINLWLLPLFKSWLIISCCGGLVIFIFLFVTFQFKLMPKIFRSNVADNLNLNPNLVANSKLNFVDKIPDGLADPLIVDPVLVQDQVATFLPVDCTLGGILLFITSVILTVIK